VFNAENSFEDGGRKMNLSEQSREKRREFLREFNSAKQCEKLRTPEVLNPHNFNLCEHAES
jgi:hypothetical protein